MLNIFQYNYIYLIIFPNSCYLCGGTGETTCDVCSGQKMVIAALNLVVNWSV